MFEIQLKFQTAKVNHFFYLHNIFLLILRASEKEWDKYQVATERKSDAVILFTRQNPIMNIYRNIEDYTTVKNSVITVGVFDGVHRGHYEIISRVKQTALETGGESAIITFSPHPRQVLYPEEKNLFLLNTEEEKIKLLEKSGIDNLIIIPFTKEFAALSHSEFVRNILIGKFHVNKLVTGYDHHFGKGRQGEFQHLINYGRKYNFSVEKISAQTIGDLAVSSTKIRNALTEGDVVTANNYLGYLYPLYGRVVKGNGIGHSLGFPTANIETTNHDKLIPADGAYAVLAEYCNKQYEGMLNIGMRPTINGTARVSEVNIFDFGKQIYGEMLNILFVERLRGEIKFASVELLKKQLVKDRAAAESCLKNCKRVIKK